MPGAPKRYETPAPLGNNPAPEGGESISPPGFESNYKLHTKLADAFARNKSPEVIASIKQEYLEKYDSGQYEGVEAMFEFVPFLELNKKLHAGEIRGTRDVFEEMTQYQFLLTDFVKNNTHDRAFLTRFWMALERLTMAAGHHDYYRRFKKGVLTQVATFEIFKYLNKHPRLSHPEEDAFESIDLFTEAGEAIQVKGTWENRPQFIEVKDRMAIGGVEMTEDRKVRNISSDMHYKAQSFGEKVEQRKKRLGPEKDFKAFMLVIPDSMYDNVTGKPSLELINFVKNAWPSIDLRKELSRAA